MSIRHSKGALLIAGVAFAVAAGVTVAVLTVLGITFQGEGPAQPESQYVGGALLTSNRDHLAICVATAGSTTGEGVMDTAVASMREALEKLANDPTWQRNSLAEPTPVVDPNCPATAAVYLTNAQPVRTGKFGLIVDQAPQVQEASQYRVFVFIVSQEDLAAKFGSEYPIATQEWLRRSVDQVIPVTLGLYVTPSQVSTPEFLSGWLLFMIGGAASPPQTGITATQN